MNIYTGIGSRETPEHVLRLMTVIADNLGMAGWTLRSGGAKGADMAFEKGADMAWRRTHGKCGNAEIYLPWRNFNGSRSALYDIDERAFAMAEDYHPAWSRCSPAARKFHARNCHQVLGIDLDTPTNFVLCWTPNGRVTGGTGQALRMALDLNIPVFNMGSEGWEEAFDKHMEEANA